MTTFRFNTFNHGEDGKRCIEDLTSILSAQLRTLGHKTQVSDKFIYGLDHINLIYESFTNGEVSTIKEARERGARFVYIATEEPTPVGFNGRLDNDMNLRQLAFPDAAQYAEAILHLAPGEQVTKWYSQYAPSAYIELGYSEELVISRGVEPKHDFGFYGQLTERRKAILNKLETLVLPFIVHSADQRDTLMQLVRVIPQIRAHDSQEIISSSRCATALHLGRPVLAEPHKLAGMWEAVISFSDSVDTFEQDALYATKHWRELHAIQIDLFSKEMPAERCIGQPLRDVGLMP